MTTTTGLTIETVGNRINVYTPEDIERGKIVVDNKDTIKTTLAISISMTLVYVFYALVFGLI